MSFSKITEVKWERTRFWCEYIESESARRNLSPYLIASLIWWESGGDPNAISSSGAVGLMQVMPKDGLAKSFACINGPCFASRPTISELKNPQFNIEFGTSLLAGYILQEESLRDGLKKYGPMDVGYYYADRILALYWQVKP